MGKAVTVRNKSNQTIYLYNDDLTKPAGVKPVPLADNASTSVPLLQGDQKRLYVAAERLTRSLEQGSLPDVFNPAADAGVEYSFFEYAYEPNNNRYTADLSYIDEFSFPLTLNFTNLGNYHAAQNGFEYGFTDIDTVIGKLRACSTAAQPWGALVWPKDPVTIWAPQPPYGAGLTRVVGPNKVWAQQRATTNPVDPKFPGMKFPGIGPWQPQSYFPFVRALPQNGTQLFVSVDNWTGWQDGLNPKVLPGIDPGRTGYVQALRAAATPDAKGKYGFFTFPNDNIQGEFTDVPEAADLTITVHPLG